MKTIIWKGHPVFKIIKEYDEQINLNVNDTVIDEQGNQLTVTTKELNIVDNVIEIHVYKHSV